MNRTVLPVILTMAQNAYVLDRDAFRSLVELDAWRCTPTAIEVMAYEDCLRRLHFFCVYVQR